jgi:hypothetical protein
VAAVPAARSEVEVRLAELVGDDSELHAVRVREDLRGVGGETVRER